MIIAPVAQLGRNGLYYGPIHHFAISQAIDSVNGEAVVNHQARISKDGIHWSSLPLLGDLQSATSSAHPNGAFQPRFFFQFKGKFYLFGATWRSQNNFESTVYCSRDLRVWTKEETDFETGPMGSDPFAGVAANDDYLVAVKPVGQLIWTDGTSWFSRDDLPLVSSGIKAYCMLGAPGGFAIGGNVSSNTVIISATSPGGTWGIRSYPFGINGPIAAATGNVALFVGHHSPQNSPNQFAYASLSDLTNWTLVPNLGDRNLDILFYIDGVMGQNAWFLGGINTWSILNPVSQLLVDMPPPWGNVSSRPRAIYFDGLYWWLHFGDGSLARSSNRIDWTEIENSGLAAERYLAAYVGPMIPRLNFQKTYNSQYLALPF